MITGKNIIDSAAIALGEIAPGASLSTSEYAECLSRLNAMLEAWSAERINVFCIQKKNYALTQNQAEYTIGGEDPSLAGSTRPVAIVAATFIVNGIGFPLEIISVEEYGQIKDRAASGQKSEKLYYDNEYPQGTIYLYPAPKATYTTTLDLFTWEPMDVLASTSDTFDMPIAYRRAVEWALAMEIAPVLRAQMTQQVVANAAAAKQSLIALNQSPAPGLAEQAQADTQVLQTVAPPALPETLKNTTR